MCGAISITVNEYRKINYEPKNTVMTRRYASRMTGAAGIVSHAIDTY